MSYKNAMAELPFGGGKAVIIGDPREKTRQRMEAFGRLVDSLGGRYITAEDVGTTTTDMGQVAAVTPFVSGLPRDAERAAEVGTTAMVAIRGRRRRSAYSSASKPPCGSASVAPALEGLRVAVQGLGGVGYPLCRLLAGGRARRFGSRTHGLVWRSECARSSGANEVPAESILSQDVDVLAPCALGAVFDSRSIPTVRARVVAGAANNQLAREEDGEALMRAGILYAPDYVINAGGIISVAHEYRGGATAAQVKAEIERIPVRLTEIFERGRREDRPTSSIADEMARERLAAGARRMVA